MVTTHEYYLKNKEKILNQTKERYLNNKEYYLQYQREYRKKNKELLKEKARNKRKNRLDEFISLLGNKCAHCGHSFDSICYDFHHINPSEKEFTIGENMLLSKERMLNEVKKCILLCSNCHRLVHKNNGT